MKDRLLGTASTGNSGTHIWWLQRSKQAVELFHCGSQTPTAARPLAEHLSMPEAIASHGDSVWLVFPASAADPERRGVLSRRAHWNPATKLYFSVPPSGDILPSLPADGDLVALAADATGPWALIAASPAERLGVRREGASAATARGATLLHLDGNAWVPVELPPEVRIASNLAPSAGGMQILAPSDDGTTVRARRVDAEWTVDRIPVPFEHARTVTTWISTGSPTAERHAVVIDDDGHSSLKYWRDDRLLSWATLPDDARPWFVGGTPDGAVVVRSRDGVAEVARIAAAATELGPFVTLIPPSFGPGGWIHMPLLAMLVMSALLAVAFVRAMSANPDGDADISTADRPPPLPIDRRIGALLFDLLIPALGVIILFRVPVLDLFLLPSWTLEIERAIPSMLLIGATCVHTFVTEVLFGTTFGKRIVGGVVLSADGSPMRIRQAFVRMVFKALILSAPILGVLILLQRDRRSISDIMAKTIVADARPDAPRGESADDDDESV